MDKKSSLKNSGRTTGLRNDYTTADIPRRESSSARYYTDDVSKKIVGGLFGGRDDDNDTWPGKSDERPEKSISTLDDDKNFIEYINSFSSHSKTSPDVGGESPKEYVSLGTGSDGKYVASISRGDKPAPKPESETEGGDDEGMLATVPFYIKISALAACFVVLITFTILILSINSLNKRLAEANAANVSARSAQSDNGRLIAENNGLRKQLDTLQEEYDKLSLEARTYPQTPLTTDDDGMVVVIDPSAQPGSTIATPPASAPPSANQSTSPPANASTTYTLSDNDTLWSLAQRFYGDGNLWTKIADANGLSEDDANHLSPGKKLIIP